MGEMGKEKVPTFLTGSQKERLRRGFIDGRIVTVIMKTASEGPGACWEHAWAVSGVCILWSFFFSPSKAKELCGAQESGLM